MNADVYPDLTPANNLISKSFCLDDKIVFWWSRMILKLLRMPWNVIQNGSTISKAYVTFLMRRNLCNFQTANSPAHQAWNWMPIQTNQCRRHGERHGGFDKM